MSKLWISAIFDQKAFQLVVYAELQFFFDVPNKHPWIRDSCEVVLSMEINDYMRESKVRILFILVSPRIVQ